MTIGDPSVGISHDLERLRALCAETAGSALQPKSRNADLVGELTVIGSGFCLADFSVEAADIITDADYVFYLTYDKLARLWLEGIRPDALDLHALYDPSVPRHFVYIRMAEVILHHVRQGKRVVAIYYGHPGVFATPAHRAVAIAKQEGHRARMRPAVSALDYIIADLGFDPALPGLLTYEATDMLLRSRVVDPSLHVVLWQVGLIGDLGYSPSGFQNRGFASLVDYLIPHYGPDYRITHYIAATFKGLLPLIETHSLSDMLEPGFAKGIRAISTFYIPPAESRLTDVLTARKLGIADGTYELEFGGIDYTAYTQHDRDAISSLGMATLGRRNAQLRRGPAYRLLEALSRSEALMREYLECPETFVLQARWNLSPREAELLAIPHSRAFEAALQINQ